MKKTIFLIILFFLCAQIVSAQDVVVLGNHTVNLDALVVGDSFVQGSECVGTNCPSFPFDFSQKPLGLITLWLDGSAPYLLMRDEEDADFAFFVDSDEFGIYNDEGTNERRIFGIDAAAPADSLFINSTGTVQSTFDGSTTAGDGLTVLYEMSANNSAAGEVSDAGFSIENAKVGFEWAFRTSEPNQAFAATKLGTGGLEFEIRNTSPDDFTNVSLVMGNGAICTQGGVWQDGSSRDYKENIKDITTTEAMKTLADLKPVKYNLKKESSNDLNVGFIAEDVPELVATKSRKTLSALEIVAVLTKVVQEQQAMVAKLSERISELEKQ